MKRMMLALCLTLVGCGYSNSNMRSRTVVENDDGYGHMSRNVTTHEGDATTVSAGLPSGADYGLYGGYGGYGPYGYGRGVAMKPRPTVQVTTPIVVTVPGGTVMTGSGSAGAPAGDPVKDAEQDKRLYRVERRTQDLRDVELRQECEKPENKDNKACKGLNAEQGGK